jgi:hypothetical protein
MYQEGAFIQYSFVYTSTFKGCAAFLKKSLAKEFKQKACPHLYRLDQVIMERRLRGPAPLRWLSGTADLLE